MADQIITKQDIVQDTSTTEEKLFDYITNKEIPNKPENREAKVPFEKRLVEEYGYHKKDMEPEFRIQKGSALIGPADIVIFYPNETHTQENIFLIVENKRKNRKDGLDQLKSYLAPCKRAQWGVWFNGEEIEYLRVTDKGYKRVFNIPKFGETLGLPRKEELKEATELVKIFGIVHNHIYANDGLSSQEAFNEVLKLLFIKIEDEKDFSDPMVKFGITEQEYDEIMSGKENGFRKRIEDLFEKVKRSYKDVFTENERINLKTSTLAFVVGQIQNFDLRHSKRDVKGAAFQKFVYAHQRGERGQFFTPDPIIELVVHFLDPKPNETILDPATGTGGFLVRAMKHVWDEYFEQRITNERERREAEIDYAHKHIRGIEINPTLAKVAKMRMILEDDGYTGIFSTNSLESWEVITRAALEQGLTDIKRGSVDVLMTNPPFGTQGKVTDRSILEQFELGWKWKEKDGRWEKQNKLLNAQVPDILFIERCLDFLKDGGRMGIVLPDGDLTNATLEYVRQHIINRARILGVVSLTQATFIPHGTGIKTSVLFLQKLSKSELEKLKKQNYEIFFGNVEKVGYEGDKHGTTTYKRDEKGEIIRNEKGDPIIDEDITEIASEYGKFVAGKKVAKSDKHFVVRFSDIEERLDTQFYHPIFVDLIEKLKSRFEVVKLREVAEIITGTQKENFDRQLNGLIPFFSIKDIKNLTLSMEEVRWARQDKRTPLLGKEDVVVAVTGATIGKTAICTFDKAATFSGDLARIRVKGIDPYYLLYFLDSTAGQMQIYRHIYGATNKHLSQKSLGEIFIPRLGKKEKDIAKEMRESIELTTKAEEKTDKVRTDLEKLLF